MNQWIMYPTWVLGAQTGVCPGNWDEPDSLERTLRYDVKPDMGNSYCTHVYTLTGKPYVKE
jgi:hypothetical protein